MNSIIQFDSPVTGETLEYLHEVVKAAFYINIF